MNFSANVSTNLSVCQFPPFCSLDAVTNCRNIPLKDCSSCSVGIGVVIILSFFILGLLTIVGNCLVFFVILSSSKKDRTKLDYIRVSLAIADIIKGLDLVIVGVPHTIRSLRQTASEIILHAAKSQGTTLAICGGLFVFFIYTSSLFHLLYMSGQRFIAVQFPFKYRNLKITHVVWHLVALWTFSFVGSSIPAWSSGDLKFGYNPEIFQYFINPKANGVGIFELVPLSIFVLLPYVIMCSLTIATTYIAKSQMRRSKHLQNNSQPTTRDKKAERSLVALTKAMVLGYTISIVPIVVLLFLEYFGEVPCARLSDVSFVIFYVSTASGLGDVVTYSLYDRNFRTQVCYHLNKIFVKRRRLFSNINLENGGSSTPKTDRRSNIPLATVT